MAEFQQHYVASCIFVAFVIALFLAVDGMQRR